MKLQDILADMRRAINDYDMIKDGDKVAVGLSGGKDSLVLLTALNAYKRFSPQQFSLCAVTIDMGLGADFTPLKEYCDTLNVECHIEQTDIGDVIFNVRKEKNPCSLCSKMRRGALNNTIKKLGCNVLALGHHADDLAETMLLSLFFEGRLSTFAPVSFMNKSEVTMIRPLVYCTEKKISLMAKGMPCVKNPCLADKNTRRQYMKNLINDICKDIPIAKDRMISAIINPDRYNLWNSDMKRK